MNLDKIKSIDELNEKDLLKLILSNQLNILRRLDFIEDTIKTTSGIKKSTIPDYDQTVSDMISNLPNGIYSINEYLSSSDFDKGEIRF